AYGSKAARYFFDFQEIYSLRSLGSAAWELALVANDRNDAFADIRGVLKAHDFAAARIVLEESGGRFDLLSSNGYNKPENIPIDDFTSGYSIIASKNMDLFNKILEDFQEHDLL
ncbi:MAG: inositol monophosphatase family protein, partial [Candidatus Kariarchaeaceae archaeon]